MSEAISPNARRWLDLISYAEGTWGGSAPRYDITFGYRPIKDLSRHPNQVVHGGKYSSAAAGAYQFMPATWANVAKQRGLKDFGPASQDIGALALIRGRGVDPNKDPITRENIAKLSGEWASLPTLEGKSAYGQPVKSFDVLNKFAQSRGAASAPSSTAAAPAAASTKSSGINLLNKFIDLLGVTGGLKLGPQSSLVAPALPSYKESASVSAQPETELLLSLYKGNRDKGPPDQKLVEEALIAEQRNLAAAEQAKAELIAQALGSFGAPSSVI